MSVTWVLVAISCIGLIAVVLAAALLSPVVVTFDSASRKVRIRWLAMLDYLLPLPAAAGRSRLSIAGKPIGLPTRHAGKKAQQPEGAARKSRRLRRRLRRFLYRCLRDSTIRRVLLKQLVDLWKRLWRSVVLTRLRTGVCLADPGLNGMLAGALAQTGWDHRWGLRVNFVDDNSLFCEIRVHPHRIVTAFLFFLSGLPYKAIFKNWRATSRARPHS
jgi:hypothetical protein